MMSEQTSRPSALAGKKALVIDDEPFAGQAVGRVLRKIGIGQVTIVESAASALELLADPDADIDIIVCDVMMPEMDGYEFARRLRYGTVPHFKNVPILMLTAHDTEKNVRSGRIHRIDGFIVKPPNVKVLGSHINRVFDLS